MKFSILIITICFILYVTNGSAQNLSDRKQYTYSFPVNAKTIVELSNKYGKMQLLTWEKDSVRVDIDFYISSPSVNRFNKLKESVSFDVSHTNYYVGVKTVFGKAQTNVIDEIKDFADAIVNGSNEVKIDYTVHIPEHQTLKVTNRYGDMYADDLTGDVQLNLSNGDLKANNFMGDAQVSVSFGNAFINEMAKGRIFSNYGDLNIRAADNITLDSKSSKIRLESGGLVRLISRHDNLQLVDVRTLVGDGNFSDINVQNITDELNLTGKFGKIFVDNMNKNFSFVNVISEYTDLDIYFEKGSAFEYDITYFKDVTLRLPREAQKTDERAVNTDPPQKEEFGKIGTDTKARVKIGAPKKCNINLYIK